MFTFPQPARRFLAPLAGLSAVALALWCLVTWQPEYQVDSKFRALLSSVEDRDWKDVADLMAPDYLDRWGFDRERTIREAREPLAQFFALEISAEDAVISLAEQEATVAANIRMNGSGTVIAEYVKSEVNSWEEPFTFRWRRLTWKPWDWKLASIDHPRVDPARYGVTP